jgi:alpha-tubulin suppressor-like RCC1 family protein
VAIAAGDFHTCALDAEGWVVCWGDNTFGQSDAPHERFVAIDADANWSLGVSAEDELAWCWGLCRAPRP